MTEAMPFLQKFDITFLRPPTIWAASFCLRSSGLFMRSALILSYFFKSREKFPSGNV